MLEESHLSQQDSDKISFKARVQCTFRRVGMELVGSEPQVQSRGQVRLVARVCEYIRANSASKITLAGLGREFGVSPFHLQRVFKSVMGMSPRRYLEECRIGNLKQSLSRGDPVTQALRKSGYSSHSWLYEDSRKKLGMTPATYRRGGEGERIGYLTGDSPLGRLLVAATSHGVCSVSLADSDDRLMRDLRNEFPRASISLSEEVRPLFEGVAGTLRGQQTSLPLDLRGTDFQLKVWSAIQGIPLGETRSYSDLAVAIGMPRAVRAVANACGSNPVPLIIPCHRVIRKDGGLGGYGLGIGRKKALLAQERAKPSTWAL